MLLRAFVGFFVLVTPGNTVGGVLLVALLNYSHTEGRWFRDRDHHQAGLSWSEYLLGQSYGSSQTSMSSEEAQREAELEAD